MSDAATAPTRTRASRAQTDAETRTRRRKFSENDEGVDFNYWVDESKLDRENFAYRFVNDVKNRVEKLIRQDWDVVSEAEMGFETDRHADISVGDGRRVDLRARLMRKPKDWFEEDHARKQRKNDDRMKAVAAANEVLGERGADGTPIGGLETSAAYKPKMSNSGFAR